MYREKLLLYTIIVILTLVVNCKREEELMRFNCNNSKNPNEIVSQIVKKWYPWIEIEDPDAKIHIQPAAQLFLTNFSIYAVDISVDIDPPMETKYVAVNKDKTVAFFLSDRNSKAFINLCEIEKFQIQDSYSGCQVAEAYLLWCSEGEKVVTSSKQLREITSEEVYAEIEESISAHRISSFWEPTITKNRKEKIFNFITWNPSGLLEFWSFNLTEEGVINAISSKEVVNITHLLGIE